MADHRVIRTRTGVSAVMLAAMLGACGGPPDTTLDASGDLTTPQARADADDVVADAVGTRFSVLEPACQRAAVEVGGEVEWAGLHCTIAVPTGSRWTVGMTASGDETDPFRRTRAVLDDAIEIDGLGREALHDPVDGTLYVRDDEGAFLFATADGPATPLARLAAMARAALRLDDQRRS